MDLPAIKADIICKILIIGDSGVGKTSVMRRFTREDYAAEYIATIGIDFSFKMVEVRNNLVKVQIWDTAGQEQYHCITSAYYRGSKAVIMAYDITERKTFDNITQWNQSFKRHGDEDVSVMLIGNKCDLEHLRSVTENEGRKLAKANDMFFSETSAKDNVNIDSVFMKLLDEIVLKELEKKKEVENVISKSESENIDLNQNKTSSGRSCCSKQA